MLMQATRPLPPERVEQLARNQGMVFPEEVVPFSGMSSGAGSSDSEKGGDEQ
ncbi:hypothetical protein [Dethiobacter alkaliphilus]|uniref:hypothetical protein n=1 Tax=Dethiobacter alkaliphilus TaxID=427926 RepID=UPI00031C2412|nr:hypothetical protein [Dethiobacter alkaliphilus]